MIQVLKASAGSGKTYALAREYLRLVLGDGRPDAYRHVLAVTFTNKATDEMKRRILKELHTLAVEPETSDYRNDFIPAVAANAEDLQKRAQVQLTGILNDYSSFAVSTIDRFFQQTLRAFSREIGQFSSYQVHLDRDALVAESVDRLLDSLTEEGDAALLDWLTRSVRDDLLESGKFSLERRLQEVAGSLQELPAEKIPFGKEELKRLREQCRDLCERYLRDVQAAAEACLNALNESGVDPADSNRGFLKGLYRYVPATHPVEKPSDAFLTKAADPALWFAKSKAKLLDLLGGRLDNPLQAFLSCFGEPYKAYVTAGIIRRQLYGLGLAAELRASFAEIQKEKNILSLDDSNTILKQIIDGTDTPFVYEKLGVRFEDFLLDEFQDTSEIQWENFRPLLHNSADQGKDSLVVGDVKQSIYRWRGSDWDLLEHRLQEEFCECRVSVLKGNYRTCSSIVGFNNAFFAFAAEQLDRVTASQGAIAALYADVAQEVRFSEPAPGSVEVCFTEDEQAEILQSLADLRGRGARWSHIAILVRGNAEGAAIASALVQEGIPVVSDDSLFVKASVTVRRLVSQLSLADAPPSGEKASAAAYLARSMALKMPERYHSLTDLAEALLREMRQAFPADFEAEIPYVQSFMDYLQDWVQGNGNNLNAFLRAWNEADPKIASPPGGDSVRIMTIHKSKGLEFPFVILPYAEKVGLYKASSRWCTPASGVDVLADAAQGVFRVSLDGRSAESFFAEDYERERKLQAVDNLNIFYVAFTRAKYGMKIISAPPSGGILSGGDDWKNLSELLYSYLGTTNYRTGEVFDFSRLEAETASAGTLPVSYPSYPAEAGDRLRFSPEAADYFGPDGTYGIAASRRIRGNVLHGILARTALPQDLPGAVEAAVASGELPAADAADARAFLEERLLSVQERGWFSPEATHRLETAVIGSDGIEYRPDRVVLFPDGRADIIDYKFGKPEKKYLSQLRAYMRQYQAMGYSPSGYIWYLFSNEINEIKLEAV